MFGLLVRWSGPSSQLIVPTIGSFLLLIRTMLVHAGHRMLLLQHHTHVLACGKNGVWTKHTSEEYRRLL